MPFPFIPAETVKVPPLAFKDSVELPASQTVILVTDMQNDFVKPEGSLCIASAVETIQPIANLLKAGRQAGVRVAYTLDSMVPDDPEFKIWPAHTVPGTWGYEVIDELKPAENDLLFPKSRYDGFYGTSLEHYLSYVWGVKHLVITGTVANICVLHTAASAGMRWFHVVLAADTVSAITEFDQALTLHQVSSLYTGSILRSSKDIKFV